MPMRPVPMRPVVMRAGWRVGRHLKTWIVSVWLMSVIDDNPRMCRTTPTPTHSPVKRTVRLASSAVADDSTFAVAANLL